MKQIEKLKKTTINILKKYGCLYMADDYTAMLLELEKEQERSYIEEDMQEAFNKGFYTAYGCKSEWIEKIEIFFKEWFEQFKNK